MIQEAKKNQDKSIEITGRGEKRRTKQLHIFYWPVDFSLSRANTHIHTICRGCVGNQFNSKWYTRFCSATGACAHTPSLARVQHEN